jgi:hypothetical protein
MKGLFALVLCSLASCAGLQSILPSSLVGEWRYADKIKGCHYVFNRNGTFSGDVVYHGKTISKFTGRWSVDGDTLLYTYVSDALDRIPAGATDRDKLLSVHRGFFIIEAANGSKRKYLRVSHRKEATDFRLTLSGGRALFVRYLLARAAGSWNYRDNKASL